MNEGLKLLVTEWFSHIVFKCKENIELIFGRSSFLKKENITMRMLGYLILISSFISPFFLSFIRKNQSK